MYALFAERKRLFTARAAGQLRCYAISFPVLKRFLLTYPEAMIILMRNTVERLLDSMQENPTAAPETTES
jgi:CRP-like cAMP-binding protein